MLRHEPSEDESTARRWFVTEWVHEVTRQGPAREDERVAVLPGSAENALAELVRGACTGPDWQLTSDEFTSWSSNLHVTPADVLRELALELAERFVSYEISFDIADDIANVLLGAATHDVEEAVSDADFWAVYAAFDAGEHIHDGRWDADPVEIYTRPYLQDALEAAGRWPIRHLEPLRAAGSDQPLADELGIDLAEAPSTRPSPASSEPRIAEAMRNAWLGRWADIAYAKQQMGRTHSPHAAAQMVLQVLDDEPDLRKVGNAEALERLVEARTTDRAKSGKLDAAIREILAKLAPTDFPPSAHNR